MSMWEKKISHMHEILLVHANILDSIWWRHSMNALSRNYGYVAMWKIECMKIEFNQSTAKQKRRETIPHRKIWNWNFDSFMLCAHHHFGNLFCVFFLSTLQSQCAGCIQWDLWSIEHDNKHFLENFLWCDMTAYEITNWRKEGIWRPFAH